MAYKLRFVQRFQQNREKDFLDLRNLLVSWAFVRSGLPGAVAVDVQCAKSLWRYKVPVKQVGRLVQIPFGETQNVLEMDSEVWTNSSIDNARIVANAAVKMGRIQNILLRVRGP